MPGINLPLKLIIELLLGAFGTTLGVVNFIVISRLVKTSRKIKLAQQDNKCDLVYVHVKLKQQLGGEVVEVIPALEVLQEDFKWYLKWIIILSLLTAISIFLMLIIIYVPGTNYWFIGGWS